MANMTDNILRWRLQLTGFTGGPGLCTFYTSTDPAVQSNANGYFKTFWDALTSNMPGGTNIVYPSSVDQLDSVTGFITDTFGVTAPSPSVAGLADNYAGGVGAQVRWHTSGTTSAIKPPHGITRVVGATFVTPLKQSAYQNDGTLSSSFITTLTNAANAMRVSFAENLRIFSRPVLDNAGTVLRAGHNAPVVSVSVKDQVAYLKSRRT